MEGPLHVAMANVPKKTTAGTGVSANVVEDGTSSMGRMEGVARAEAVNSF